MVRNGVIPSDWEDSFIINIYKGEGDALERGNYRGLKLLDHVMKGIERVIEKIIQSSNRMEWRKKLGTNIGAVRPTLSGTDTLNE